MSCHACRKKRPNINNANTFGPNQKIQGIIKKARAEASKHDQYCYSNDARRFVFASSAMDVNSAMLLPGRQARPDQGTRQLCFFCVCKHVWPSIARQQGLRDCNASALAPIAFIALHSCLCFLRELCGDSLSLLPACLAIDDNLIAHARSHGE